MTALPFHVNMKSQNNSLAQILPGKITQKLWPY